ncbi:MAG TPA: hypothetical protein DIS79_02420 [Bacteroidetes bacterium]|nr:hypothetical protein [Bacteroidota bacterium]
MVGESMIRTLTAVFAALALTTTVACAQETQVAKTGGPKFEVVGGETYDWGKVGAPKSGYLEATIKMKNAGNGIMKLVEVRPGCGCTKTDPDKMEVPAGDVSTMNVKLNISPMQAGPITKSITVRWGDKAGLEARDEFKKNGTAIPAGLDTTEHQAFIFLKADVQRDIVFQPGQYFSFSQMKVGQEATAKVEITNNGQKDVVLSDFVTDGGLVLNVMTKQTIKPGAKLELIAKVVPTIKGAYSGGVKFKTNHPDHAEIDVRAWGNVEESASPVFQKSQPK